MQNRQKHRRNIIWFNPSFSKNVATGTGKKFLKIIYSEFSNDHPLHKMINRNTTKMSYCCMTNMRRITQRHSKPVLQKKKATHESATVDSQWKVL